VRERVVPPSVTPGPKKSAARTSTALIRPCPASSRVRSQTAARARPLGPVAASGRSSVSGPVTGPYPYRLPSMTRTAPVASAAVCSDAVSGGQSSAQRWSGGAAQP
jgi:hypothetical protein